MTRRGKPRKSTSRPCSPSSTTTTCRRRRSGRSRRGRRRAASRSRAGGRRPARPGTTRRLRRVPGGAAADTSALGATLKSALDGMVRTGDLSRSRRRPSCASTGASRRPARPSTAAASGPARREDREDVRRGAAHVEEGGGGVRWRGSSARRSRRKGRASPATAASTARRGSSSGTHRLEGQGGVVVFVSLLLSRRLASRARWCILRRSAWRSLLFTILSGERVVFGPNRACSLVVARPRLFAWPRTTGVPGRAQSFRRNCKAPRGRDGDDRFAAASSTGQELAVSAFVGRD